MPEARFAVLRIPHCSFGITIRPPCAARRSSVPCRGCRICHALPLSRAGLAFFACRLRPSPSAGVGLLAAQPLGRGAQPAAHALRLGRLGAWRPSRPRRSGCIRCRPARSARLRRCRRGGSRDAGCACSRPAGASKRGAIVSNSLLTTSRSWMSRSTSRRACRLLPLAAPPAIPRLAMRDDPLDERPQLLRLRHRRFDVLVLEAAPCAWLRSIAMRCSVTRPSLR